MSKLCIPEKVLAQHVVVLGKTGAGKSSALRHIVEHLLSKGKRVVIVDPKGDWWGLKAPGEGHAGYPVVAFGDFKETAAADVPINNQSGKHVAELVASGNRPCIIGFRGWMPAAMTRFWVDFASTLFNANSDELYLVVDEVHNFCPKGKVMNPEVGESIHWTNRLLAEGRGLGIVALIASQRPQKVHNDTLTSCETLVAMRVIHKADRQALKDWIDGCGDGTTGNELLANIASLPRGSGYVWSPEIGYGPVLVKFPMFETFDSFAPSKLQKTVNKSTWADVDLGEVKDKLASVIEEAKANDPRVLKAEIAKLRSQVGKRSTIITPPADAPKNNALKSKLRAALALLQSTMKIIAHINASKFTGLTMSPEEITNALAAAVKQVGRQAEEKIGGALKQVQRIQAEATTLQANIEKLLAGDLEITVAVVHNEPFTVKPNAPRAPRLTPTVIGASADLPRGELATLKACAQYDNGATREQLTVLTGYKRSSRDAYVQRLREKQFVECRGDYVTATQAGVDALGSNYEPLPTGDVLREHYMRILPEGERKVLEVLVLAFPSTVLRETIDEHTGYQRSSRDAYIQRLNAKRLVETDRGVVRASPQLFD